MMEREQIMKALEYCIPFSPKCGECPYRDIAEIDGCIPTNMRNALALIKELTDELTDAEAEAKNAIDIAEGNIRAEIASGGNSCHWCEDKVRADTVRKMQERLKEYLDDFYTTDEDALLDVPDLIDQIAKEMLDEKDE